MHHSRIQNDGSTNTTVHEIRGDGVTVGRPQYSTLYLYVYRLDRYPWPTRSDGPLDWPLGQIPSMAKCLQHAVPTDHPETLVGL